MRPRHKAAENQLALVFPGPGQGLASMRPRHKAAENPPRRRWSPPPPRASMRPRHKAAENPGTRPRTGPTRAGFNEAAA